MTAVEPPAADRIERGFETPDWLRARLRELSRTRLWYAVATALFDHAAITMCGVVAAMTLAESPMPQALFVCGCLFVLSARCMRGLECLVHEGSHSNWTRMRVGGFRGGRSVVNDRLTNALAAWPVLSEVEQYALTHILHHVLLGSDTDTDLIRWRELDVEHLDRTRRARFLTGLARRLLRYVPGWWRAIGVRRKTVTRFAIWHGIWILGLALVMPVPDALAVWVLGWLLPLAFVLPMLRFIGEIEEHEYSDAMTVLSATYSNVGFWQRLLLHPHCDAFHTLHHLYPSVPFFRVRSLHRELVERERATFGRRVPVRRSLFASWNNG